MKRRARIAGLITVLAIGGVAAQPGAATASRWPNVNWTSLLPTLPSPLKKPGSVQHCRKPRVRCISIEVRRLTHLRDKLGCDHRAVFATTYLELTKELLRTVEAEPRFFRDPRYLYTEDALFADVYFNTFGAWERGQPVPEAWRIAFQAARSGDFNAGQDMLLGINAHVQNDMPFVLATLGLRTPTGESRKPDHDAVNEVLRRAYQPVIDAVASRYDPLLKQTNLSEAAALALVRGWREEVWRNAERLVNASSSQERQTVANQIKANAAAWGRMITAGLGVPGYRARRDVYCAQHLGRSGANHPKAGKPGLPIPVPG